MDDFPVLPLTGDIGRIRVEGVNALGPLENLIMSIIWMYGEATMPTVYRWLRDHQPAAEERAYTTISNTLAQLVAKGFLSQEQASGTKQRVYLYTPLISREEYRSQVVVRVLDVLEQFAPKQVQDYISSH